MLRSANEVSDLDLMNLRAAGARVEMNVSVGGGEKGNAVLWR